MVCRMEKTKDKKGVERLRGMGYIWTKAKFDDFKLELEYKLSEGANSESSIEQTKMIQFKVV